MLDIESEVLGSIITEGNILFSRSKASDANTGIIAGSLELAYSLIWGSHKIWGKGGGDSLDLL